MLSDIKPYNEEEWKNQFSYSPLCARLSNDFDELTWAYYFGDFSPGREFPVTVMTGGFSPRQVYGDKIFCKVSRFSASIFYYLEFLTEKNPKTIYDLGCGWNIFKKYISSVIGIGAEPLGREDFFGDIRDFVDDEFIRGHQNYFESVFSICALHFYPLSDIRKRVLDFASMIKPSGRGLVTFNIQRMIENDQSKKLDSKQELELWIRQQLSNLPFNVLQFDCNLTNLDNPMDGNVRLIIEK
jgi:hypothetical protein